MLVFGFKIATVDAWLEWLVKQMKPFINKVKVVFDFIGAPNILE